jgi:hypothetical protein
MLAAMMTSSGRVFATRVTLANGVFGGSANWTVPVGVTQVYLTFAGRSGFAHSLQVSGADSPGAGGAGGGFQMPLSVTPGNQYNLAVTSSGSAPELWLFTDTTAGVNTVVSYEDGSSTLAGGGQIGPAGPHGGRGGNCSWYVSPVTSVSGGAGGLSSSTGAGGNGGNGTLTAIGGGCIYSGGGGGGGGDVSPAANGGTGGSVGSLAGMPFSAARGGGGSSLVNIGQSGYTNSGSQQENAFFFIEYD